MSEVEAPTESRMKRLRVGDRVSWEDDSEWPPIHMEGEITEFTNVEGTYLKVDFTYTDDKDKEHSVTKELTEDDVTRVA